MSTSDIYEQHRKAFNTVSAYVVMDKEGNKFGTVAFKFPKDGAMRLWCYVHYFGVPMVRGYASGYGYDKGSAAAACAAVKIGQGCDVTDEWELECMRSFRDALMKDDGHTWQYNLQQAGFEVHQAV